MNRRDNEFLYLIKFIACLCVICIHTRFPGIVGEFVDALSRFAVPYFFVLSGRYLLKGIDLGDVSAIRKKVSKSLCRLLKVTAVVYSVHLIFSLIVHLCRGISVTEWLSIKFNLTEAIWFVFFNSGRFIYDSSYVFDHMWFLFALIYVYIIIYIFAPLLKRWTGAVCALLLFGMFFGEILQSVYPIRPFDISITTWYILRNFLFEGIPFVFMGIIFSNYVDSKKEALNIKAFAISGWILLITGIVSTCFERYFIGTKEVHIGSVLMVLGIFLLSETGIGGGKILWKLGRDASANIYYYHVILIALYDIAYNKDIIKYQLMWGRPLIIMSVSIVILGIIPILVKRKKV